MDDDDMTEAVAAALWREQTVGAGVPQSVINGMTPEAFREENPETRAKWHKYARAALATIFQSDGNEEDRWIYDCENACPACGGSGHKDDVTRATQDMAHVVIDIKRPYHRPETFLRLAKDLPTDTPA